MKKYLILGVNGFLGKQLCLKLLSRNNCVIGYDIAPSVPGDEFSAMQYVRGNFVTDESFDTLLEDVDTVIHLVSTTLPTCGTDNIYKEISENLIPTVRLLDSMIRCGTRQIIFASSGGTVYGDTGKHANGTNERLHPISSYGAQKKMIETILELYGNTYGMTYRIARIANLYGIGQDSTRQQGVIPIFVNRILNDLPITIYGDTCRDYIYADDVIDALIKLIDYSGDKTIFNIGTGTSRSLKEVLAKICECIGHDPVSVDVQPIRIFDVKENHLDVTDTEKMLNWSAKVSLEEGIARVVAFAERGKTIYKQ
jgi:UDP-glucose 4-epimerase